MEGLLNNLIKAIPSKVSKLKIRPEELYRVIAQRSSRGSKVSGVSLLTCEYGGIYAEGGIKLDVFVWEDGSVVWFI